MQTYYQAPLPVSVPHSASPADAIDFRKCMAAIVDRKWLVAGIAALVSALGTSYAFLSAPVYESNLSIQVEDRSGASVSFFDQVTEGADAKISTVAREIEILRSRLVIAPVVDKARLDLVVRPDYFPLIGEAIARRSEGLSTPGLFGLPGYVWGKEQASVPAFQVPPALEGTPFSLVLEPAGRYLLRQDEEGIRAQGRIGEPLLVSHDKGVIEILVDRIEAKPGARFTVMRLPKAEAVRKLQEALQISERGKQSGIIGVTLEGSDPRRVAEILGYIGEGYLAQNEDRKSQNAEKQLTFLDQQLPGLKQQLERTETRYNELRNRRGTVDLGEEAKNVLSQSVSTQARMAELRQKKEDLLIRFQEEHPAITSIDQQMQALQRDLKVAEGKIRKLPLVEQDVVRLARDMEVSKEVYAAVLTTAYQLRLITASKALNVRLLDHPILSAVPVKPRRALLAVLSGIAGLILGGLAALGKKGFIDKVDYPQEVEQSLGLTVAATIPYSPTQKRLKLNGSRNNGRSIPLLPDLVPGDQAIEGLRDLRSLLVSSIPHAPNNVVMITGPTSGVGKSFVSANLAVLLASIGKKVLVIDADLRTGHLHDYFSVRKGSGLSDAIADGLGLDAVIYPQVMRNVDFLPSGSATARPADLLENPALGRLLQLISVRYDVVLIDTPPVIGFPDALTIGAHAGMIFNVVRARVNAVEEIELAVKRLNQAGRRVTGTVFNGLKPGMAGSYYSLKHTRYDTVGEER